MAEHKARVHSKQHPQHELLKRPYARILIPEDDGTYTADMLEFPGCHAEGNTAPEAIENLEEAAAAWIDAAIEQGQEIPLPMTAHGYSGKINLRLPKSIHKQAARFAQRDDVSLNQFFTNAIAARVGAEELYERLVQSLERRLPFTIGPVTLVQKSWTIMLLMPSSEMLPQHQVTDAIWEDRTPRLTVEAKRVTAND